MPFIYSTSVAQLVLDPIFEIDPCSNESISNHTWYTK